MMTGITEPMFKAPVDRGQGRMRAQGPGGLYVHVPFCLKKCPYCDFYSITDLSLTRAYLTALETEMTLTGPSPFIFDTLYLGGGTPSVLDTGQTARIIDGVQKNFILQKGCEITLEVNPGTVSFQDFQDFYRIGVNRINIGIQSFQDGHLTFLGRIHTAAQAEDALENARRAGFDNVGFDLMYGLPGQGVDDWLKELERAVSHGPRHLSCYMLSYEKGTRMDHDRQKGVFRPLPDQRVGKLFTVTTAFLQDHGIFQYEISNYAVSLGTRSRHNQKYWHFDPYIGLGPGAHSFTDPERFWNHRDMDAYLSLLQHGNRPVAGRETVNREQQMIEAIYLGLRTTDGIDLARFADRFDVDFTQMFGTVGDELAGRGLIHMADGRCALTRPGMLMLDSIVDRFVTQV